MNKFHFPCKQIVKTKQKSSAEKVNFLLKMFSNERQSVVPVQTTSKTMISLHFPDHNVHVRDILERIFDQSASSGDVLLKVGPDLREFHCHRAILSFSSEFLNKLLTTVTNKDPVLILPEFDANIIECVLLYIYTGEVNNIENINGFLEVCTLLEIKGIIDQQYKLLDLIEASNVDPTVEYEKEATEREVIDEYTIVPTSSDQSSAEEGYDENDMMEVEYVDMEEDPTETGNHSTEVSVVSPPQPETPKPIIISKATTEAKPSEKGPPPKKVRLKNEALPKHILRLEKLNFAFNEIEGSVGSWKHARLLTDGTANINAANAQYFKERLEVCTAKLYENVPPDEPNMEKYKVRMFFCSDPVRLKALVECLICEKSIQVSYKHKNGKFKQWINSNVLRHVETFHKSQKGGDEAKKSGRR